MIAMVIMVTMVINIMMLTPVLAETQNMEYLVCLHRIKTLVSILGSPCMSDRASLCMSDVAGIETIWNEVKIVVFRTF